MQSKPHLHLAQPATKPTASTEVPPTAPAEVLRRAPGPSGGEYRATSTGLCFAKEDFVVELSNFDARIVGRIRRDGAPTVALAVRVGEREHHLELSVREFDSLSWVGAVPGAVIWPGAAVRGHLRAAIAVLSQQIEEAVVRNQVGWSKLPSGEHGYVHGDGVIAGDPPTDLLEMPTALADFSMDFGTSSPGDVLGLLEVVPDHIGIPLLASAVRALLGDVRFAVHVFGQTGTGKSCVAGLVQSLWGPRLVDRLPANWGSTPAALEQITHAAGDAVLVVDDFIDGQAGDERGYDALVRAASNAGGRARYGRAAKGPRCLILSTSEHALSFPSLVARTLHVHVGPQDVDWKVLTHRQAAARDGVYTRWMSAFIRWLAPRLEEARADFRANAVSLRSTFTRPNLHARSVDALAEMGAALLLLFGYLVSTGAVDRADARGLTQRAEKALSRLGANQVAIQLRAQPDLLVLETLRDLVREGTVALPGEREADVPGVVGWQLESEVLIDPGLALDAVQDRLSSTGAGLHHSATQIAKLLHGRGLLARVDLRGSAVRYTVRATVGGRQRKVWALRPGTLK